MLSVVSNMCKPSTDFVVSEQKENESNCRCLPRTDWKKLVLGVTFFLKIPWDALHRIPGCQVYFISENELYMYVCMTVGQKISLHAVCFGFFIFMCNISSFGVSQLQSHYVSTFAVEEHMLAKLFCSVLIEVCVRCYQPLCQNCFIMWSYVYLWSPGHQDFALALETGDNCWVLNFYDLVPIIVGPLVMKLYTMWTYFLIPS
jgi:hypothetical protein